MRSRYLLSIHTFGIILVAAASAQSTPEHATERFAAGVYGGYGLSVLRAGFAVDNNGAITANGDCGRFERGSGSAPVFGVMAELPLSTALNAGAAVQFHQRGGELRYPCVDPASTRLPDGTVVPAITDHVADVAYSTISARFQLLYQPLDIPLRLGAGPAIAYIPGGGTYAAREEIVTPAAAEFLTGGQVRNYGAGTFADGGRLSFGITAGVSYRAPIGRRWMLVPELAGLFTLGNDRATAALRAHDVQATLGVMYRFQSEPTPLAPVAIATPPEPEPGLDVSLTANAQSPDGRASDTLMIEQTGVVASKLHPLLTFVFFDEGDAAIPARYRRRTSADADAFGIDRLRGLGTLDIYYNMLDIVGMRMRRYPEATITLTGTQPEQPGNDRLNLAAARADAVRRYLQDVWRIQPGRISVATRVDPLLKSNPETRDGAAENRRVEIASTTYEITEPLLLADTSAENIAQPAWLAPRVASESEIDTWTIVVTGGRIHDAIFSGTGVPPAHLTLPHDFIDAAAATRPPAFGMSLTVRNRAGEQMSDSTRLPLRWVDKLSDIRFGSGSYSLILFDFNSAQLRPEHLRTIDLVNARGDTNTHAGVFGYTDMLGSDDLNRTLSQQRAAAVATHLRAHVDEIEGRGETTLLYDNTLPEGRFYSRTVTIETKAP